MPVTPPYSIIGDIARLKEQEGAATGEMYKSVGQSLGGGIEKGVRTYDAKQRADAQARQDFFLNAQKTGVVRHAPPMAQQPPTAPAGTPPGATGGAPAPTILGGPQSPSAVSTGTAAAPSAAPAGPLPPQKGEMTLADMARQSGADKYFDKAHMDVLEHTAWKPNAVEESQVQENLQQMNAALKKELAQKAIEGKMLETHHLVTAEEAKQYPALKAMEGGYTTNKAYEEIVKPQTPGGHGAGGSALTEDEIKANVRSMKDGTPLSMLGGMGSQKGKLNAAYQKERDKNPRLLSIMELENTRTAEQTRTKTLNTKAMTDELSSIEQFNSAIDQSLALSKKIGAGGFVPYNKLKQYTASQIQGSKFSEDLATLKALNTEIALQSSRVFSGTAATDIRVKQEMDRLNTANSAAVYGDVAAALKQIANVRKTTLLGAPSYVPGGKAVDVRTAPNTEGGGVKYSDPAKAKSIADAYKAGPKTPAAYAKAQKDLEALRK